MQIVGLLISWAVAIGIIGIGIGYAAKSEMNATRFGLPQLPEREARGWWQVKGVRDIVSGVLVKWLYRSAANRPTSEMRQERRLRLA